MKLLLVGNPAAGTGRGRRRLERVEHALRAEGADVTTVLTERVGHARTLLESPPDELSLLSNYFPGYTVSWSGAVIGFAWAAFAFFVAGWCCAFVRNFTIVASVWLVRTRAELVAARDFLDHI